MPSRKKPHLTPKAKRDLLRGIFFLAAIAVAFVYWSATRPIQPLDIPSEISADAVGPATDFELSAPGKAALRLESLKGKPILLNFWASWCPPCLQEMPSFLRFAQWAKKELGVEVVAVSVDRKWGAVEKMFASAPFRTKVSALPFVVLHDADAKVAAKYGASKFPETFFIDRKFNVTRKFSGAQNWTSEEITKWVSENSAP